MSFYPTTQTNRRGLTIDDRMRLVVPSEKDEKTGSDSIFAIGDCTSTAYAPTAQVASQQGAYLGRMFNQIAKQEAVVSKLDALDSPTRDNLPENVEAEKLKLRKQLERLSVTQWSPFHYSHQGSLAYIGSDKAIADLPFPLVHGNVTFHSPLISRVSHLLSSDCLSRRSHLPLLAFCLLVDSLFPSESRPRRLGLAQDQGFRTVG
jgi:NADH:ubiquinone reductase (non-electrogenic)